MTAPGLYAMSFAGYRAIHAANNSSLGELYRSPLHALHAMRTEKDPTAAMVFGTRSHLALFEPEIFDRLVVVEKIDKRTKAFRELADLHGEENLIAEKDFSRIQGVLTALKNHPAASRLLDQAADAKLFERSLVWNDVDHDVLCKGRPDALIPDKGTILDLKTTNDASSDEFQSTIFNRGYHRQAAMYLAGMQAVMPDIDWRHFIVLAVETSEPYGVSVVRISDKYLALARRELSYLLQVWKRCHETNEWPCYSSQIIELDPPKWADQAVDQRMSWELTGEQEAANE